MRRQGLALVLVAVLMVPLAVLVLGHRASNGPIPSGAALPPAERVEGAGSMTPAPTPGRVTLWLCVEIAPPHLPSEVRLSVENMSSGHGVGWAQPISLGPGAHAAVDVTALVAVASGRTSFLSLVAEHSACMPARALVVAPRDCSAGCVLQARLRLLPALLCTGRVQHPPVADPPIAFHVAAFPVEDFPSGAEADRVCGWCEAVDETLTDTNVRYTLRVPTPGDYVVVAGGTGWGMDSPEWIPDAVCVRVVGIEQQIPDLVLRDGAGVGGHVFLNSAPLPWSFGSVVTAYPMPVSWWRALQFTWADTVRWGKDGLLPSPALGSIQEGVFAIEGLVPGLWRLVVSPPTTTLGVDPTILKDAVRTVEVPTSHVEMHLEGVEVTVLVHDANGVVSGATVRLERGRGGSERRTNEDGQADFLLVPGEQYSIRVSAPGHDMARFERLVSPNTSHVKWEVSIPSATDRGVVRVVVRDQSDLPVAGACVVVSAGEPSVRLQGRTDEEGRLVLRDVPAGSGSVLVQPARVGDPGFAYLLAAEHKLRVQANERTDCNVVLKAGGLLSFDVWNPEGRRIPATCALRNAQGHEWRGSFASFTELGGVERDTRLVAAPTLTASALSPGTYEAVLTHPTYGSDTLRVEVQTGRTTRAEVTLGPR